MNESLLASLQDQLFAIQTDWRRILESMELLTSLLAKQETILTNQAVIEANQKKIDAVITSLRSIQETQSLILAGKRCELRSAADFNVAKRPAAIRGISVKY